MNRITLARRYGPLLGVVAIQLLIIATVPSRAPGSGAASVSAAGGSGTAGALSGGEQAQAGGGAGGGPAGGPGGTGGTAAAGGGAAGGAAGGGAGGAGATPPGVSNTGDTTHCVKGREFDPAIAYWAPPCVPGTPGGAYPNNGGNTYQGATKDTITIVDYVSDYGAEVNAILQAEGLLETYDDAVKLDKTFESFINQKYVLFGRKVHIIPYKGQCQSVPPQKDCLLPEMDRIVDTYHPYIVFWPTTLCSECYAELARKKTVAIGGVGFSDEFTNANAPYFYSSGESATHIEQAFAQFWCAQMSSVNVPSRTVKFAEHNNPAQDFNGQKRVLGVISTNDPDNENTVKNVLVPALKRGCNEDVTHFYFYDQDINTAAKQVAAGIAAMDTPQNPATSVLCLCDPVAPAFLYNGEQSNNYYPENVLADVQGMGYDNTGQSYGANPKDGSATLGCPNPKQGCEFDNAVGLIESEPDEPAANDAGLRIFHVGGGQGDPPTTPLTTTSLAKSWVMMGNLLEATGPNLTPANMQAQAPAMGTLGGAAANVALLGFSKNDWNWTQDARIVYWNAHKTSAYNGLAGTYVSIEGSRYNLGAYPSVNDGPPAPTPDKRT